MNARAYVDTTTTKRSHEHFTPIGDPMNSDPITADDFDRPITTDHATFDHFPVVVEVGSGDLPRFTTEND